VNGAQKIGFTSKAKQINERDENHLEKSNVLRGILEDIKIRIDKFVKYNFYTEHVARRFTWY
jgi:hypothetical protein